MEKTEILLETEQKLPPLGKALRPAPAPKAKQKTSLSQAGRYGTLWAMVYLWSGGEVLQILHPLAMSILTVFLGSGRVFWLALSAAVLGGMGNGVALKHGAVLLAATLIHLTLGRFVTAEETLKKALLGAFAMALGGCFYAVGQGGLTFYFVVAGVESAMVLGISLLVQKGAGVLFVPKRTAVWSREETLSVLLILGGALTGAAQMELPFLQDRLFPVLTALFLLVAAWREGVGGGAAAGALMGFLLFACGVGNLSLFAVLALGGLLAGCLKDVGRLFAGLTFWMTAVLFSFYGEPVFANKEQLLWLGVGALLFLFLPQKILAGAGGLWQANQAKDRYTQMREMAEERLRGFGKAFHGLAKVFGGEEELRRQEISALVDTVAEKVCQSCGMAHYCWDEEVYRTYSMTFSALSCCDGAGRVTTEQLPAWFQEMCPRKEAFAQTVCTVYERYRQDLVWAGRLQECRNLVGQQLDAVGGILEELTGQMDTGCIILENLQESLTLALRKAGIRVREVQVTEEKGGRGKQVRLVVRGCNGRGICRETILPVVRKTLGRQMEQADENVCQLEGEGCVLTFVEAPVFALTAATAFAAGEMGKPCGDASSFLESERGTALLAVSDGMGTGEKAAAESKAAIELLEQFAAAGFSRELAVQLINSALLLRRAEENYATLDICSIDLYDGQAEFIKLGAVASFICRGNRVISVYAHTLPAGILEQVRVEKNDMRLKDGDLILLLTDGITDAFGGERQTAQWLEEKFLPQSFANPQDAADFILQAAQEHCQKEPDDMTVQAARFWKKIA